VTPWTFYPPNPRNMRLDFQPREQEVIDCSDNVVEGPWREVTDVRHHQGAVSREQLDRAGMSFEGNHTKVTMPRSL
jgi:hypothetical protein